MMLSDYEQEVPEFRSDGQEGEYVRKPAKRLFSPELNDAIEYHQATDDEQATIWTILPTGARANRVHIIGALSSSRILEQDIVHGIIDDGAGEVYCFAGEYAPDAAEKLRRIDPPATVAVVGKLQHYEGHVSVKPEEVYETTEAHRRYWVNKTAKHTASRIRGCIDEDFSTAPQAEVANALYDNNLGKYRDASMEALEQVFGADSLSETKQTE